MDNNQIAAERILILPLDRRSMLDLHKGARRSIHGYSPHTQWPGPELLDALPVMINDLEDDTSSFGWHAWAVVEKRSGMIIGDVGFKGPPDNEKLVEMGYSIVAPFRGNGYGKEAVSALSGYAMGSGDVERIRAKVDKRNLPSKGLLGSLGWEHVSDNDDIEVWEYEGVR